MSVVHTFPSAPLSTLLLCMGRSGGLSTFLLCKRTMGVLPHPCPKKSPEARGVQGLFSCILSAVVFPSLPQQWASWAFWVDLEATLSPPLPPRRVCMHACIDMCIYVCHSCPVPFLSQTFEVTHNLPIREDLLLVWGAHWSTGRQASLTEFVIRLSDSCLEPVCRSHIVPGFVPILWSS